MYISPVQPSPFKFLSVKNREMGLSSLNIKTNCESVAESEICFGKTDGVITAKVFLGKKALQLLSYTEIQKAKTYRMTNDNLTVEGAIVLDICCHAAEVPISRSASSYRKHPRSHLLDLKTQKDAVGHFWEAAAGCRIPMRL